MFCFRAIVAMRVTWLGEYDLHFTCEQFEHVGKAK